MIVVLEKLFVGSFLGGKKVGSSCPRRITWQAIFSEVFVQFCIGDFQG